MGRRKIIVAIDGYSACGKSTTAKEVAKHLDYVFIDSGAMYRAVTYYFLNNFVNWENEEEVSAALDDIDIFFRRRENVLQPETFLNGDNIEAEIRTMEVSKKVSEVSAISLVRKQMVALQQQMGKDRGVVMDGRDIGTTVFPDAELKLFMSADMEVRALRRQKELMEKNQPVDLSEIIENIRHRDYFDTHRKESPLTKAEDAIAIDTTHLTIQEQVEHVLSMVDQRINELEQVS